MCFMCVTFDNVIGLGFMPTAFITGSWIHLSLLSITVKPRKKNKEKIKSFPILASTPLLGPVLPLIAVVQN